MKDRPLIALFIFMLVFVLTLPLWINLLTLSKGRDIAAPELDLGGDAKLCVESTEFMKAHHMELLNQWRDSVVRNSNRIYINSQGKRFSMSLQNTCMECHQDKEGFCDRCHNYVGVTPKCWDCHIEPKFSIKEHPRETH